MPRRAPPTESPPKGKKLHSDALTPPKKAHFNASELEALDPADNKSDLYWKNPHAAATSSQFIVQLLDEKEQEARRHREFSASSLGKGGARNRSASPTKRDASPDGSKKPKSPAKSVTFARSAFSSAQPSMTEADQKEYYSKVYPFNYLTLQDFKATADSIERVYQIEAMTGHGEGSDTKSKTMEAIVLFCRFLESDSPLKLHDCVCVDLMSFGGEVALYGSAFAFQRIISVELTDSSRKRTADLVSRIHGLSDRVTILVGTFRDYFPYDAQVYYLDCTWLCDGRTFVDEFVIIKQLFSLCSRIEQVGTYAYLCLLTQTKELEPVRDFGAKHMKVLLRTVIHFGLPDECVAWIFQVLPPKDAKESAAVRPAKGDRTRNMAELVSGDVY